MTPTLAVSGLSKRFDNVIALSDVTLDVAAGEVVAVLGPSGSGKSTLFRCITRLTEPDAGRIRVDGQAIDALAPATLRRARGDIGVVFQQFNLVRRRSALANVMTARLPSLPLWRVALGRYPQALREQAARCAARPARRHALGRTAAAGGDRTRPDAGEPRPSRR